MKEEEKESVCRVVNKYAPVTEEEKERFMVMIEALKEQFLAGNLSAAAVLFINKAPTLEEETFSAACSGDAVRLMVGMSTLYDMLKDQIVSYQPPTEEDTIN